MNDLAKKHLQLQRQHGRDLAFAMSLVVVSFVCFGGGVGWVVWHAFNHAH